MKLMIVSAGKNTRFGEEKSLQKIKGIENILNTYTLFKRYVSDTYVVVRPEKLQLYKRLLGKVKYVLLDRSEGSGQAVRDALKEVPNDTYFITWGDMVFKDAGFMKEITKRIDKKTLNIVVERLQKTYAPYLLDERNRPFMAFHGRLNKSSLVDRGVFFAQKDILLFYLEKLKPTETGDYRFLDVVNVMYNNNHPARLIEVRNSGIRTFNTRQELEEIMNGID